MSQYTPAELYEEAKEFAGRGGACSEEQFMAALKKALKIVWHRGDWKGSLAYARLCCVDCCITMPWDWEVIRDAWLDNGRNIMVADEWYQDVPSTGLSSCCGENCFGKLTPAANNGLATIFPQPRGCGGFFIQATFGCELGEDGFAKEEQEDAEILVSGLDHNNMPIKTKVSKSNPMSSMLLSGIVTLNKPETKVPVALRAVHADGSGTTFLGLYHPQQKGCKLKQYNLNRKDCGNSIIVRYKKKLICPGWNDPIPLDAEIDAIIHLLTAANELGRDNEKYIQSLNLAEESLNEMIEEVSSDWGQPVSIICESEDNPNLTPNTRFNHSQYYRGNH